MDCNKLFSAVQCNATHRGELLTDGQAGQGQGGSRRVSYCSNFLEDVPFDLVPGAHFGADDDRKGLHDTFNGEDGSGREIQTTRPAGPLSVCMPE